MQAKSEYVYYRTDHHWTTQGAYLAYKEFCEKRDLEPCDCNSQEKHEIGGFYGTSYASSRQWNAFADVITYYDLTNKLVIYKTLGENHFEKEEETGLYDKEKLQTRDKYGMFLHGNNGYSTIEGKGKGNIIVIKDSYGNCFIPFLSNNYERIDVVDLRNYGYSLDSLINAERYDNILMLYNFQSFVSDTCLSNLMRPSMF